MLEKHVCRYCGMTICHPFCRGPLIRYLKMNGRCATTRHERWRVAKTQAQLGKEALDE